MGLVDSSAHPIRAFAHVKVTNTKSGFFERTGTVIAVNLVRQRVAVAFPGGEVRWMSSRSVKVVVPRSHRK